MTPRPVLSIPSALTQRREHIMLDLLDRLLAVHLNELSGALVVVDERFGLLEVHVKAVPARLNRIIGALLELSAALIATTGFLGRRRDDVVRRAAAAADPPAA